MTKELSKTIMWQTKLRIHFLKLKSMNQECNITDKDITDNKKIGANVKQLFSNKIKSTEYIN